MDDRHVLITGCSSGIGEALVPILREAGFTVHATARKSKDVERLRSQGISTELMDMMDIESIRSGFAAVMKASKGSLYAVVNNAGYAVRGAVTDVRPEDVRHQFETNVFGPIELSRLALETMRASGEGRIINISSIVALHPFPYLGLYSASKAALDSISDAMHNETAPEGIHVSVVHLGPINTRFQKNTEATIENLNADTADSPVYKAIQARMKANKQFSGGSSHSLPPQAACDVILHALTAKSPKRRYRVTTVAEIIHLFSRFAPIWLKDAFSRHMLKKLEEMP
ncbi:SDR family NAD(P)-dependent oxidoreductase [Desulfobacter vibrioformis]|uniref:SDR family NAD(P)-dependent oxidoreductase n=1 Tax=Desulfobacter vibrioformis TaxID=34031 RepID=UPI00068BA76D|nr:SDR family NAD(P)-dependent oxidoreductase [Desulfobacter vibrioformis]